MSDDKRQLPDDLWKLPPKWKWAAMSDIAQIVAGSTPSTGDLDNFDGEVSWVTPADLTGYRRKLIARGRRNLTAKGYSSCSARMVPPGTVLFSSRAPIGYVAIAEGELCTNQGFKNFILNNGVLPDYVYYYLQFAKPIAIALASGTTFAELSARQAAKIPVPVPPTTEQRRIVESIEELFSDLDAGVALLEKVARNLDRYRASVLKAAVVGKLSATWRKKHKDVEPASELLKRILAERRNRWEKEQLSKFNTSGKEVPKGWKERYEEPSPPDTSELPELPKGWCWVSVDQLIMEPLCNGISIKGSDEPPGTPALKLNAMSNSGFDYSAIRYLPLDEATAEDLAVRENDFFVSRGNGSIHLVGRGTLAQKPMERVVFPDTMIRARLFPTNGIPQWVASIWSSFPVRRQIEKRIKTTAGIWKIAQPQVESIVLPLPPSDEIETILAEIARQQSTITNLVAQIQSSLQRSVRLRQSILKRAFAGRLVPQDPKDTPVRLHSPDEPSSNLENDRSLRRTAKRRAKPRLIENALFSTAEN